MWDTRKGGGEGGRHHRSEVCEEEWHNKDEDESGGTSRTRNDDTTQATTNCCTSLSLCMGGHVCNAHACTQVVHMHGSRRADSDCCLLSLWSRERIWGMGPHKEFQTSKAIFHFPPQLSTVLWEHSTCDTHPSPDTARAQRWINRCSKCSKNQAECVGMQQAAWGWRFKPAALSETLLHPPSALHSFSLISPLLNVSFGTLLPCLQPSTNTRGEPSNCINRWPESIKHTQIKRWTHLLHVEAD